MKKKAKGRKDSMGSFTARTVPLNFPPDACDLNRKQRRRFYEALVLLHTLNSTRGIRTNYDEGGTQDPHTMPLAKLRRKALSALAYVCDYDKGGDTVAAIGVQARPQGPCYWIASNKASPEKVIRFLQSLLETLYQAMSLRGAPLKTLQDDITTRCLAFADQRIRKYKPLLFEKIRRCLRYLQNQKDSKPGLRQWLESWQAHSSNKKLCDSAYEQRKDDFMIELARLGREKVIGVGGDSISNAFELVRHYIGRLGHHHRAVETLVVAASRLPNLFIGFDIFSLPKPQKVPAPVPDGEVTEADIVNRMLPGGSPRFPHYRNSLLDLEAKHGVFTRFKESFANTNFQPRVHAELQILEHFYAHNLPFEDDDPFIACSKPACYCCAMYIRHHPGRFVQPDSHQRLYLNWRPPNVDVSYGPVNQSHTRDIVIKMTADVRKEVFQEMDGKLPRFAWHPDSVTGITESIRHDDAVSTCSPFPQESNQTEDSLPDEESQFHETFHEVSNVGPESKVFLDLVALIARLKTLATQAEGSRGPGWVNQTRGILEMADQTLIRIKLASGVDEDGGVSL